MIKKESQKMIYKKLFLVFIIFIGTCIPSFAEKTSVKIEPAQLISTNLDEIETGDYINFEIAKDVYLNDNLYIKKTTPVKGLVDFVHPNGWGGDSAEIVFKNFYTTDINGKKIVISYPLIINGQIEMANNIRSVSSKVVVDLATRFIKPVCIYLGFIVRGAEINIEPDTRVFNIFIER